MARDIEEFLRRAAERRQQQKGGARPPQQQPQEPIEIIEPEVVHRPPPKRQPVTKRSPSTLQQRRQQQHQQQRKQPLKERLEQRDRDRERDMRNESIDEHVSRHLDTSDIAQHADRLGDRIAGASQRIDTAIHQRLDHDVSRIDDRPTITDDPRQGVVGHETAPLAADLLEMLASPKSIRQAILITEVLNRPDFDAFDD